MCLNPGEGAAGGRVSPNIRPGQDLTNLSFIEMLPRPVRGAAERVEATAAFEP